MAGMVCVKCGAESGVSDTRTDKATGWVQRWRYCKKCSYVWNTLELPVPPLPKESPTVAKFKLQVIAALSAAAPALPQRAERRLRREREKPA